MASGNSAATSGLPVTSIMPLPTASVAAPSISIQKPDGDPTCVTAAIISVRPVRWNANPTLAPFFKPKPSSIGPKNSSEIAMPQSAAPPISPT